MLNEARVNYEVVNVLDEQFNPGVREAIKTFSQWPTIPQASLTQQRLQCTRCCLKVYKGTNITTL